MSLAPSAWTVVVTDPAGQEVGRYPLKPGAPLRIGRAPDSHVMIGAMTVSRQHGRIELSASGLPVYRNEAGATGACVDGEPAEDATALGERTELTLAGYRFALVRARAMTSTPAVTAPDPAPAAPPGLADTLLDRHIAGVRSHRSETRGEDALRAERWERDWRTVVEQARGVQARYGRHPLMLEFAISKDEREILVKLRENSARGYAYFCLARQHPDGLYPELRAVWLRELGRPDQSFPEPLRGLDDLMARLASRMA